MNYHVYNFVCIFVFFFFIVLQYQLILGDINLQKLTSIKFRFKEDIWTSSSLTSFILISSSFLHLSNSPSPPPPCSTFLNPTSYPLHISSKWLFYSTTKVPSCVCCWQCSNVKFIQKSIVLQYIISWHLCTRSVPPAKWRTDFDVNLILFVVFNKRL